MASMSVTDSIRPVISKRTPVGEMAFPLVRRQLRQIFNYRQGRRIAPTARPDNIGSLGNMRFIAMPRLGQPASNYKNLDKFYPACYI
jgi:hypothetical protein